MRNYAISKPVFGKKNDPATLYMSLHLRDISHDFGATAAVAGAGFEAADGEILCLFGPSGCGKTTLLRIAAGLESLQSGEVLLDGDLLASPGNETPPERRPIGFVFQDFVLFPHMTVEKNIAFGLASGAGRKEKNATEKVAVQIEAMELNGLARRYPHELSGGQQQRVALARALIREPRALLLDEPFASIDAALRRQLREDLRRMLKEQNVAVVLVTHDPEEALALGDRIALMRAGRIVEIASPAALYKKPATPEGAMIFPGSQILSGPIDKGTLASPFGVFAAPGLRAGPGLAILRDGAVGASRDKGGAYEIVDSRFVGPGWAAYLSSTIGSGVLRVAMAEKPRIGATVSIDIQASSIFIFENQ